MQTTTANKTISHGFVCCRLFYTSIHTLVAHTNGDWTEMHRKTQWWQDKVKRQSCIHCASCLLSDKALLGIWFMPFIFLYVCLTKQQTFETEIPQHLICLLLQTVFLLRQIALLTNKQTNKKPNNNWCLLGVPALTHPTQYQKYHLFKVPVENCMKCIDNMYCIFYTKKIWCKLLLQDGIILKLCHTVFLHEPGTTKGKHGLHGISFITDWTYTKKYDHIISISNISQSTMCTLCFFSPISWCAVMLKSRWAVHTHKYKSQKPDSVDWVICIDFRLGKIQSSDTNQMQPPHTLPQWFVLHLNPFSYQNINSSVCT